MGSPTYPNASQIATLDKASEVAPESVAVAKVSVTESTITVTLAPYSAVHVAL